jgi:hypothetical protein
MNNEKKNVHRLASSNMTVIDYVEKQSDGEMLVMVVISYGEGTARNI